MGPGTSAPKRPNFLVIMTDQQRADGVRCLWPSWRGPATPLRTPNLDALADGGTSFRNAFCNHPICMPSRATLLTGLTPRGHGSRMNGINLDPRWPTVPGLLAEAGWRTHSVGKVHARTWEDPWGVDMARAAPSDHPESIRMWESGSISRLPLPYYGFTTAEFVGGHGPWMWGEYSAWLRANHPREAAKFTWEAGTRPAGAPKSCFRLEMPPEIHYNAWIADRSIAFLEGAMRDGAPFMLWSSFPDPHGPFSAPEPWYSMYDRSALPPPVRRDGELETMAPHVRKEAEEGRMTDAALREITAVTFGMISFVDQQIGRLLAALDRLGLADSTVVAFISDHGEMLGDHWMEGKGAWPWDGINRTPAIWRFPGRFPAGRTPDCLASHLDFAPTLLELAGVPAPILTSIPADSPRVPEKPFPLPGRSLVPVLEGSADAVRKSALIEFDAETWNGLRMRTIVTRKGQLTMYVGEKGSEPYGDLFDTNADPGQLRNLWDDPGAQGMKSDLRNLLLEEIISTDSLLPRQHAGF